MFWLPDSPRWSVARWAATPGRPFPFADPASGDVSDRAGLVGVGLDDEIAVPADHGHRAAGPTRGNWQNQRAYYELCYSDTVPLYGAELLSQGKFPYKSSWLELDAAGRPRTQFDGSTAVRYMEYPVLTGLYQYVSMALAKTHTAVAKAVKWAPLSNVAEVVMFFNIAAFGLALAWLATVWAAASWPDAESGMPHW